MANLEPAYAQVPQNIPLQQIEGVPNAQVIELHFPDRVEVEGEIQQESCCYRCCNKVMPYAFFIKVLSILGILGGITALGVTDHADNKDQGMGWQGIVSAIIFLGGIATFKLISDEESRREEAVRNLN